MHPYAVAARTATRFIETEQRRTRAGQGEGEVGDDGWRKIRPGLWIQRDHEQEHIGPPSEESDVTTPPFIQSTLACALYFRKFWDLTSSQPVLAVAVPPEIKLPSEDPVARYADRADGRALREWADRGDVVVHVYGQRDESESDEDVPDVGDALSAPNGEDGFVDQEEARVVTLTSPSDDPRARPSRRPPPVAPRAPPATADRVLKIFDAEKGMVPSTEVLAQRERERERELRNGRRGRGKPPAAVRPPRLHTTNAPSAPAAPVILRRVPAVPDWQPEQRERPPNAQWSRGRKDAPRGARSVRGAKPVNAVEEGPKVMLLQRPK